MAYRSGTEPWRVGVLFSRTGVTAVIEETQLRGTLLAIEEINAAGGINGRELAPIIYDPGSDEGNFARLADHLLTDDGVTMIFGCYTSSSRKAVLPIVERRNGLLWYPTLYEGFEYSPNIIYTGAAPNQNSVELADFLVERYGPRFYLIGSDYIYPRESCAICFAAAAAPSWASIISTCMRALRNSASSCERCADPPRTSSSRPWSARPRSIFTRPMPRRDLIRASCPSPA